ncbi:YbhB/YbcL family Raf kinase inhibitor-like protein [Nocardia sp. CDC153]|uniref:YbhB/YbcL family Raf kinase inhibitor-like protein n=1 Tax=Nocardia sp. CDC153 TaxID=3112167 RepID=UPI002DB5E98D|nr:YbhB/YbcL family Raf kinase inhibitor-like protein [Nocardia sp. CDC153]MEC3952675.1 YbhB/YbcL family Raf kinase inhibitor-like protein [Nocardia sp. CDC153]
MAIIGKLLRNRRAAAEDLAWYRPNLGEGGVFEVTSADFDHESRLDLRHANKRAGGQDVSPALAWSGVPAQTAQQLLIVEDQDAPFGGPFVHALALLDPEVKELPSGALASDATREGVTMLRSSWGRGYMGPAPVRGHGPHRYVFQVFALTEPVVLTGGRALASAKPREVLAAARAHGRGRIDGFYERD